MIFSLHVCGSLWNPTRSHDNMQLVYSWHKHQRWGECEQDFCITGLSNRWPSERQQYLRCGSSADTAVFPKAIKIISVSHVVYVRVFRIKTRHMHISLGPWYRMRLWNMMIPLYYLFNRWLFNRVFCSWDWVKWTNTKINISILALMATDYLLDQWWPKFNGFWRQ